MKSLVVVRNIINVVVQLTVRMRLLKSIQATIHTISAVVMHQVMLSLNGLMLTIILPLIKQASLRMVLCQLDNLLLQLKTERNLKILLVKCKAHIVAVAEIIMSSILTVQLTLQLGLQHLHKLNGCRFLSRIKICRLIPFLNRLTIRLIVLLACQLQSVA